jgi:hypothetical protein
VVRPATPRRRFTRDGVVTAAAFALGIASLLITHRLAGKGGTMGPHHRSRQQLLSVNSPMVDINYPFSHPCAMKTLVRAGLDGHIVCEARKAISYQFKVENRDGVARR